MPTSTLEQRALVISSAYTEAEAVQQIGRQAYSYFFVYKAFAPLLQRWGTTVEISRAESRLDYALWNARKQNLVPAHLSFLPLHATYLTHQAPNVAFPFWEFPDIPTDSIAHNPRNNWARVAERLSMILTASTCTRDAFVRAGVRTPIHIVPVPVRPEYFDVPAWQREQRVVLDCPCYSFPGPDDSPKGVNPWVAAESGRRNWVLRAKRYYQRHLRPCLPPALDRSLSLVNRIAQACRPPRKPSSLYPMSPTLDLSGVVYTSILNPFDPRKNFRDLLSAFIRALGDKDDATLVLKVVVGKELEGIALKNILGYYGTLGQGHRCQVRFVTEYLSDAQMVELARASTYYLSASHAEGACLPLQDFLAAGRPGISPLHTAMTDYFREGCGFVVDSHPEPTYWPHDPAKRLTTSWHRLVWQSLHDQIRASYVMARENQAVYQAKAGRAREQITDHASLDNVWPRLAAALDSLHLGDSQPEQMAADTSSVPACKG